MEQHAERVEGHSGVEKNGDDAAWLDEYAKVPPPSPLKRRYIHSNTKAKPMKVDETKLWRELLDLSNTVARVSLKIMTAYRFTIGQSLLSYCERLLIDWHKLYRYQVFKVEQREQAVAFMSDMTMFKAYLDIGENLGLFNLAKDYTDIVMLVDNVTRQFNGYCKSRHIELED